MIITRDEDKRTPPTEELHEPELTNHTAVVPRPGLLPAATAPPPQEPEFFQGNGSQPPFLGKSFQGLVLSLSSTQLLPKLHQQYQWDQELTGNPVATTNGHSMA